MVLQSVRVPRQKFSIAWFSLLAAFGSLLMTMLSIKYLGSKIDVSNFDVDVDHHLQQKHWEETYSFRLDGTRNIFVWENAELIISRGS